MGLFLFALFGGGVALVIWSVVDTAKKREQAAAFKALHPGFDLYVSKFGPKVLGINRDSNEVMLGTLAAPAKYELSAVASVEILKDGSSVTTTNRGSQLAGAALGGIALGGVGVLLGGLSGATKTQATIRSLSMKVIVDDRTAPVHTIPFYWTPISKGIAASSPLLYAPLAELDRYHALLVNALRAATQEREDARSIKAEIVAGDTADQLSRLWDLKQAGALTEEEFNTQKSRLLADPQSAPLLES